MGRRISDFISVFLRNAGSAEANVNGSVTPVEFSFSPTVKCEIHRMFVTVRDAGAFASDEYGNIAGGLTNGVEFEATDATGTLDMLDGAPIQTNLDWSERCYDAEPKEYSGTQSVALVARWTFAKSGIPLFMSPGDLLVIRINDDLTPLLSHRFLIQGYYSQPRGGVSGERATIAL